MKREKRKVPLEVTWSLSSWDAAAGETLRKSTKTEFLSFTFIFKIKCRLTPLRTPTI